MKYSIIVPVYNRPNEMSELLQSISLQQFKDFEVIVVEDGSTVTCKEIVDQYKSQIDNLHYYFKENSGPGLSRNYGAERAKGEYLLILDSDVILPDTYLNSIESELKHKHADAFGGPDAAHESFSDVQKAINYSMTSFYTTGGIRGAKKRMDKFYPRTFNFGIRKDVFMNLGGFGTWRFGEDIDFSIRIFKAGYSCQLFPTAWVWHKRRTNMVRFFRQVVNCGVARINLYKKHPESLKLVYLLPMIFTIGWFLTLLATIVGYYIDGWHGFTTGIPLVIYALLLFIDAYRTCSLRVSAYAVIAAHIQLLGYGIGFLYGWWRRCVLKKDENTTLFLKNFYR